MRRLVAFTAGAAILAGVLAFSSRADVDSTRAARSYAAMQRWFFDPHTGGWRETPGSKPGEHAWPSSQALAAMLELARLPRTGAVVTRAAAAEVTRLRQRFGTGHVYAAWPGGAVYWDDNEWIALDLLDWNAIHSNPAARTAALNVFGAVARAWDDDGTKPCAGGVQWTDAPGNDDRNTVSTANGAVLGLRLYRLTHRPVLLWWSERMLAWLDQCMLSPNGLYWDHIDGSGAVDRTQWSYNQGAVLGAYVLLYQTTGQAPALAHAEAVADAALAYLGPRWSSEPPAFAAIFFRYLLQLAAADGRSAYVAAARSYADREWRTARNPKTGLFSSGGQARLLDQAAFVQLYAALAAAAPAS
jgi:hypothetical protein